MTPAVVAALSFATLQQQDPPKDTARVSEIVVTGTRTEGVAPSVQPSAVSLIIPSDIQRTVGRVAADLLRETPGVQIQQTSAGQGAVILRGLVGNQVLLLVDGIPLNNSTYRDGPGQYLATIDPETIERIEVVRGPASVLYGSDAQGGVVNMITRPHPLHADQGVRIAATASSANNGYRSRASLGVRTGRWNISAGASFADADNLRPGGGLAAQDPTGFETEGLDARASYPAGDNHLLTLAAHHFTMHDVPRYDRYVTFRAPASGADVQHIFDPQTRQLAYVRHLYTPATPLLRRLETTASLAVQREGRTRQRLLVTGPEPIIERVRDNVFTPGLSIVGSSGISAGGQNVSLTWGGDFYADRLSSKGSTKDLSLSSVVPITRATETGKIDSGRFPDDSKARRVGVFLSAESQLASRLKLSVGGRWSSFRNEADVGVDFGGRVENSSSDFTGQIGLVASFSTRWIMAFRVAEGFRAPNLYDLTNVGPVPGGIVLPNTSATPERSLSSEVTGRYVTSLTGANITFYRTTIRDFIDRTPSTFNGDTLFNGERVFQGTNVGEAEIWGVEAEAVQQLGSVEVRGTLLYTRGDQASASGIEEPMSKIPPLKGSASARWLSQTGHLQLEYRLRWAGPQNRLGSRDLRDSRIEDGGTPGYVVHGLSFSTHLTSSITANGGIDNVTDKLYRDHASGVDNPGRHVWIGVSWIGRW